MGTSALSSHHGEREEVMLHLPLKQLPRHGSNIFRQKSRGAGGLPA